jgi:hypothetical protein
VSKASEFRQYADEAMRWADQANSAEEREACIDLAHKWAQASFQSEAVFADDAPKSKNE